MYMEEYYQSSDLEDENAFEGPDAYLEEDEGDWDMEYDSDHAHEWTDTDSLDDAQAYELYGPNGAILGGLSSDDGSTELDKPETNEPQQGGLELLMSGDFGPVGNKIRARRNKVNVTSYLTDRTHTRMWTYKQDIASNLVPNSNGTIVALYSDNVYCGQFSTDASLYYTCTKDFRLHIYDTNALRTPIPPRATSRRFREHQTTMKVVNNITGCRGQWTITDAHLSPDNERMIYSSLTPIVYMTRTRDNHPVQVPINLAESGHEAPAYFYHHLEIWSCRFSADGNEVIAGGSGRIFVYDLLADRRTVNISAHTDDVNSCCWADTASGNVLVSASDDTFIKIWDRRSLGASPKPSGVLVGHTEGITFVSSKGDGRYVISNGKDQNLKLWDLRKMRSNEEFAAIEYDSYHLAGFDYRGHRYPKRLRRTHPQDCSVMTYRGHIVASTLIRCHFSPAETTGSQYIYSGSDDGKIHIWSLDGRVVQVLDRSRTLPICADPSGPETLAYTPRGRCCVRDVSWSSQEPVMMSTAWGSHQQPEGSVARHEWKGLSKTSGALEDWVQQHPMNPSQRPRRSVSIRVG